MSGNDLLQFWWDDPRTSVVLLYLETFGNPRKFTRIAREMARTKPIVAVKSGRTLAAEPTTSRVAGSARCGRRMRPVDAFLAQSGVIRVETPPELFAVARVLLHQPMPKGRGVAVVCNSKGATTFAVDACARAGLDVSRGRDDDVARRARRLSSRPIADRARPTMTWTRSCSCTRRRCASNATRSGRSRREHPRTMTAVGSPKPVLATFLGGERRTDRSRSGPVTLPLFEFPGDAARVLGLVAQHGLWLSQPEGERLAPAIRTAEERSPAIVDPRSRRPTVTGSIGSRPRSCSRPSGSTWPTTAPSTPSDDAVDRPPRPRSSGCAEGHRRRAVTTEARVAVSRSICTTTTRCAPPIDGWTNSSARRCIPAVVQAMVGPGADVLVGAHQHPSFGGVMSVGIGGVMAAANPDLPMRILPVTDADAGRLVASSPIASLLAAESPDGEATAACQSFLAQLSGVLEAGARDRRHLAEPVDRAGRAASASWTRGSESRRTVGIPRRRCVGSRDARATRARVGEDASRPR